MRAASTSAPGCTSPPAPQTSPVHRARCTLELSAVRQTLPCLTALFRSLLPLLVVSTVALCWGWLCAPSITSCSPPDGSLWRRQHRVLQGEGWPRGAELPAVGLGVPARLCQVNMALWSLQRQLWGGIGAFLLDGGNERSQGLVSCHLLSASSGIPGFSSSGTSASPPEGMAAEDPG